MCIERLTHLLTCMHCTAVNYSNELHSVSNRAVVVQVTTSIAIDQLRVYVHVYTCTCTMACRHTENHGVCRRRLPVNHQSVLAIVQNRALVLRCNAAAAAAVD